MEEIKQEEVVEVKEEVQQPQFDFSSFNEAISKLQKENEVMKAEIIKLKNREVIVNPPQEEKKREVDKKD